MDKEIIIHLGFPRNASTYIQKFVLPLFASDECFYVQLGGELFNEINEVLLTITQKPAYDYDAAELKKQVEKLLSGRKEKKIIISNETLVGPMFGNFLTGKQIAEQLKEVFGNVKFVVVFRRQDRFVESMYRMAVRMGYFHSMQKYLRYHNRQFHTSEAENHYIHSRLQHSMSLDINTLYYTRRIRFYYELLGKDDVLAVPLELLETDIESFTSQLGNFMDLEPSSMPEAPAFNTSYQVNVVKLGAFLNRFAMADTNGLGFLPLRRKHKKKDPAERTLFDKIISRLDLEHFYLFLRKHIKDDREEVSPALSQKIRETFTEDNKELAKLVRHDLEQYGYF